LSILRTRNLSKSLIEKPGLFSIHKKQESGKNNTTVREKERERTGLCEWLVWVERESRNYLGCVSGWYGLREEVKVVCVSRR
jgi:hypothetical protein